MESTGRPTYQEFVLLLADRDATVAALAFFAFVTQFPSVDSLMPRLFAISTNDRS